MTDDREKWTFDVALERTPHRTRAHILLKSPDNHEFCGVGLAHDVRDAEEVAQVGTYLAIGRALSDLTEELLEAVVIDVETAAARLDRPAPLARA
ncbi:dsRBD fold-containing protein [Amycolatopsis sp. NPDC059027]|uniref:dsRBD fold-containing protein n=1 Tax=unclassified Amycolatopsis TaxID=2618356 RepID=UPI003671FF21